MSKATIIPTSFRSSLLSRKHCASILRPPNLLGFSSFPHRASVSAGRIGVHPNSSHLRLPSFALRAFSSSSPRSSTRVPFRYSISAAFSDKRRRLDLAHNFYTHDSLREIAKLAAPSGSEKRKAERVKSGQDSFFISQIGRSENVAFGVVDGVGGWEEQGVDPADFAHSLCEYMAETASAGTESSETASKVAQLQPLDILDAGYNRVMADDSISAGGSTACVATVSSNGILHAANLGDSGYVHISPFRLKFLSPAQTHRFNTPFQLSKVPKEELERIALFGGARQYSEMPSDSALTQQELKHGDVLVFATDGVWDNLSAEDALRAVTKYMVKFGAWLDSEAGTVPGVSPDFSDIVQKATLKVSSSSSSQEAEPFINGLSAVLATVVTHEAKVASLDRKRNGPFAKEVQRVYPQENWQGGKQDDICTVVAVVMQEGM